MADYWAHVERDADSLRGEERMHLGVAAQCEGANLVRLERIEGEGADKGHVHAQGAVPADALAAHDHAEVGRSPREALVRPAVGARVVARLLQRHAVPRGGLHGKPPPPGLVHTRSCDGRRSIGLGRYFVVVVVWRWLLR